MKSEKLISNEQIAHDLAVAAAGVMLNNLIKNQESLSDPELDNRQQYNNLENMVHFYQKIHTDLILICNDKL